jgi:hypothetical protein
LSEIPKFVLSRMERVSPQSHPDPDVLTAFIERALPDGERTRVLEHLASCADCRDVVALAQPETAAQMQKGFVPARRGLLRWPALRWVAVAACFAVGAGIALEVFRQPKPAQFSTTSKNEVPPAAQGASEPALARNEAKAESGSDRSASAPLTEKHATSAPEPASRGLVARKVAPAEESKTAVLDQKAQFGGYSQQIVPKAADKLTANAAPSRQNERADYDKNAGYQGYSNAMAKPMPGLAGKQVAAAPAQGAGVGGMAETDTRNKELAKTKSEAAGKKGDEIAANQPDSGDAHVMSELKDRRKAVPSGGLAGAPTPAKAQAAPDATPKGMQETVEVTAASPAVQAETVTTSVLQTTAMLRAPAILPRWRLTKERQLERASTIDNKWQTVPLEGQPVLHALFSSGPNVWVGGKDGVLFHSGDAGEHWQRVTVSHDSSTLAEDIIAIDFQDFQHGQFKTDKNAVWITSDGGQTWTPK